MKILGIDEAGKGPVIGPMVICGYLIDSKNEKLLKDTGVKDSKMLSISAREKIYPKLRKISEKVKVLKIKASKIDEFRETTNMNKFEILKIEEIIEKLKPDKVIIDALESNTEKFRKKICPNIEGEFEMVCENFADKKYPVVSAASVIAKVNRDREMLKISKKYGFKGTGYPSDENTINFLKKWISKNKDFPIEVRKSWMTSILMKEEKEQSRLGSFFE